MAEYLHGAYGQIQAVGTKVAARSQNAIVYVGTAPVQTLEGGSANVNRPILVNNIAEARKYFGYSEDWAKYTLCEAMHAHFEINAVGPLVLINVLDPTKHVSETGGNKSLTPANGRVTIVDAEDEDLIHRCGVLRLRLNRHQFVHLLHDRIDVVDLLVGQRSVRKCLRHRVAQILTQFLRLADSRLVTIIQRVDYAVPY